MARREFSRKTRAQAFERAKGFCEGTGCGARLKPGEAQFDHILPAELGGEPALTNCQVLCHPCHKAKTADDIRRIRKGDRQRDRETGAMPKSPRGFRTTVKSPAVSRHAPLPPKQLFREATR
jgi:5-methylcytosine-specific restriction enzyme A